jgi:peptide methionine sulfoxide reductase msrA/msrB
MLSCMFALLRWSIVLALLCSGCSRGETRSVLPASEHGVAAKTTASASAVPATPGGESSAAPSPQPTSESVAILAGGCFWGMQELLRQLPGVRRTLVGYTGGQLKEPEYGDVKTGRTGHAESVQVVFDPSQLSYERLLAYFFTIHDPTTKNQQGNDVGTQYRSVIFVLDAEQRRVAEKMIERVGASGDWKAPITTEVTEATEFYPAEEQHQDYLQKNPGGYTCHYARQTSYY